MNKIYLLGDSTCQTNNEDTYPQTGWGQLLNLFVNENYEVVNLAKNGRSTKSFIDEGLFETCKNNLKENDIVIISGCASGADAMGQRYAEENGFKVEKYPADWKKYGKGAGPIRNKQMAEVCDYVICFWDGESKGTKSMIDLAAKYNKPIKIKRHTVYTIIDCL